MVCLETTFLVDFLRGKEEAESVFNDLVDRGSQITITSPSLMEIMSCAHQKIDAPPRLKSRGLKRCSIFGCSKC